MNSKVFIIVVVLGLGVGSWIFFKSRGFESPTSKPPTQEVSNSAVPTPPEKKETIAEKALRVELTHHSAPEHLDEWEAQLWDLQEKQRVNQAKVRRMAAGDLDKFRRLSSRSNQLSKEDQKQLQEVSFFLKTRRMLTLYAKRLDTNEIPMIDLATVIRDYENKQMSYDDFSLAVREIDQQIKKLLQEPQ